MYNREAIEKVYHNLMEDYEAVRKQLSELQNSLPINQESQFTKERLVAVLEVKKESLVRDIREYFNILDRH